MAGAECHSHEAEKEMTNKSDSIGELAAALAKAQGVIKSAAKDATNPFFKSNYADLPAVVKACKQALSENAIAYIQTTEFEGQDIWLETILIHSSGQWVSGRYPVRPVKNDPQGLGSALTYARRYSLAAMAGVVAENEDDDAEAAQGRPTQREAIHGVSTLKAVPELISEEQLNNITQLLIRFNADVPKFCAYMNVNAVKDIPAGQYARAIASLNLKAAQK